VTIAFGAQLWSQASDWPRFRDAALEAETSGWDSLWTWDHLMAIQGPWRQPIFEGWTTLAAWAAVTSRIRLGLMVGANTFRNPGLTAKLVTTLDHISDGRAILGIGGAWFEREHDALGIDFGSGFGERLDRLDEAVGLIRRLLDGELVDHDGPVYPMHQAELHPRPIQPRLPILVGGSGPKKTLRTVARYADAWNSSGTVETVTGQLAVLAAHCADIGRDPASIERTISFPMVIRDRRPDAEAAYRALLAGNGVSADLIAGTTPIPTLLGDPESIAAQLVPYHRLGFSSVIIRLPAPYDAETLARVGEIRTAFDGLVGAGSAG
jgi:F420-dependent oxidoreductase-like protein